MQTVVDRYQVMPPLSEEDYAALKADIAERGVQVPVEYDEKGNILDGYHRARACMELDITDWPKLVRWGLSEAEKRAHARKLNLARRHLTREQRRVLIEEALREAPDLSNRQHAAALGVDHKTVGTVRTEAVATGEIPQFTHTLGADGKLRPVERKTEAPVPPQPAPTKEWAVEDEAPANLTPSPEPEQILRHDAALRMSETNEWYTPPEYIEAVRQVLGRIDMDPASCTEANAVVRADRYCDRQMDGLAQPWEGRVWLNPPYGGLNAKFALRLVEEYQAGNVEAAVLLVNAHCTDTAWFQPLWDYTMCFTDHRINFRSPESRASGSTHGSVFVYLGPNPGRFAEVFGQFGAIVRRWSP